MRDFSFATECYLDIAVHLSNRGFREKAVGQFILPISENLVGWLGLNRVRRTRDELELYPVVGVVHNEINELIFNPKISKSNFSPTISVPLCYLSASNSYRTWTWKRSEQIQPITCDLIELLDKAGMPFINRFTFLEELYSEAMLIYKDPSLSRCNINYQRVLPAIMYLRAMFDEIEPFIEKERSSVAAVGIDSDFEHFVNGLTSRMKD